ncbi:MAG TPA: methylenetetrahydrofolate--tRNA-(uracil(54)-C(5))-methyltransferase (FADH(2)-oxidizing) TrmFO [Coriobacteriia bacterium]|nr:methylenetetrahydrofolate--tRNA-(uracil(54)-C(5))-methyltransferase (FADH(2)-oxidizing) TrmFO [Coriobacteriia bacterium]
MAAQERKVTVIGGGLAGSEAALQLARRGMPVTLVEMRPETMTPAHHAAELAELVCSNSFKSDDSTSAAGAFKRELEAMGCILLEIAREHAVPAGAALAVDRGTFSAAVTAAVEAEPLIELVRVEATDIPAEGLVIVATGPLTSPGLEAALSEIVGADRLSFYDAAAPVIEADSLDRSIVFAASRYDKGEGADYLNAPMERDEYERFYEALIAADRVTLKDFERRELFAACQPAEEVARSGPDALRFGALKPVGLTDPRSGRRPWAVVQLRAENRECTAYNLVGFQTNLTFAAQREVFRLIPGLENAEFARYGVMHRNTFVDAPKLLDRTLAVATDPRIRFAGQLTGTEGYMEAVGSGLFAALNTYAALEGSDPVVLPKTSVFGALLDYATDPETADYQPMHVNYGIIPPLPERVKGKRERYAVYSQRAQDDLAEWIATRPDIFGER